MSGQYIAMFNEKICYELSLSLFHIGSSIEEPLYIQNKGSQPLCFSGVFTKRNNFCDLLLASLDKKFF